jgi:hypothetical protein
MATGKTATKNVIINNVKTATVSKVVELIVINDQLIPHLNEVEPGVNSKDLKN